MSGDTPTTATSRRGRQSTENKAQSRQRLICAALDILETEGEAGLSTTRVAKMAGLAQPSFYVHFENMDELLDCLIVEVLDGWRAETGESRRLARAAPGDVERFRDTFRVPIRKLVDGSQLFRIVMRNRFDTSTAIGRWSTEMLTEMRRELTDDLVAGGLPAATAAERRRAEMVADSLSAMTAELVLGHLDGRYPDIEEIVDVLAAMSRDRLTP
jgi:TetR/AcrR family transcriptional regulator, fatty acid biosynthesis regulator